MFLTAASITDASAINSNGTRTILASGVGRFFIDGVLADINGLRKSKNAPSWLVISLVVPFNEIPFFLET